jgi:hypothetical protein
MAKSSKVAGTRIADALGESFDQYPCVHTQRCRYLQDIQQGRVSLASFKVTYVRSVKSGSIT